MTKTENHNSNREYNMDLLRVILIFMVIVLHYNNRGMGGALNYAAVGGAKEWILRISESLSICAVDAFLMLSGYFAGNSQKSPYRKALWLLASCSFYRTVAYLLHASLVIHEFSVRSLIGYAIPSNWFVCLFASLLILMPYIDKQLNLTTKDKLNELILVCSGLFVLLPTIVNLAYDIIGIDISGLTTITILGDAEGFNIVTFVYCYIVGFFIRKKKEYFDRIGFLSCIIIFLLASGLAASISFKTEKIWSYASVLCVLEAMALVIAFSKIQIKSVNVGKVLGAVGGCAFGVFIWHTTPLMLYGFWVHFGIANIGNMTIGGYLINMFVATIAMYFVSAIWVYVCRLISGFVLRKIKK